MITHHPNCNANYPEKPKGEAPRRIIEEKMDGFTIRTCVDCGAFESDLPDADDPYWSMADAPLDEGKR